MGRIQSRTTLALIVCAVGAVGGIAVGGAGCSSPGENPPNLQDCRAPACLQPGPPNTSPLAQGSTPNIEDAGVVDAEVVVLDGSGIPASGPGPGITGSTTTIGNNSAANELLGPVCPITAPSNGAPCAPAVNTIACIYSIETCFCTTDWICF